MVLAGAIFMIPVLVHLVVLADVDALWAWVMTCAVIIIGLIDHVFIVVVWVRVLIVRFEWAKNLIREWTGDITVRMI